jgi:hypothetical protein
MDIANDELITTEEAAAILTVRINTMERWRCFGVGPEFVKLGDSPQSQVRYKRSAVLAWRDRRTFKSTSAFTAAVKQNMSAPATTKGA